MLYEHRFMMVINWIWSKALPIYYVFVFPTDVELLVRGDNAQCVPLPCLCLRINHICAQVHVHSTLW